jgi:hypothetical protein
MGPNRDQDTSNVDGQSVAEFDDMDVKMTEAMVHDLLKKNKQLSDNLQGLRSAYNELIAATPLSPLIIPVSALTSVPHNQPSVEG